MIFSRHAWQNSNDIKRALVVPFTFVLFACAFMSFVLFVALFLWRVHNFLAPCVLFRCYCVSECKQASNIREIHQESAFMLKKKKKKTNGTNEQMWAAKPMFKTRKMLTLKWQQTEAAKGNCENDM